MSQKSKVIPFPQRFKPKDQVELLRYAVNTMSNYFLMWDQNDQFLVCNEKVFDLYPNARDIFVVGRTFEEVIRMGIEKGDFEIPEQMTAEEWIQHRIVLHKRGDYVEVKQVKGLWLQIRDQKTPEGYTVSTAVDVTYLKEQEEELVAAKERAAQAESLLYDALDSMSDAFLLWDKEDKLVLCNKRVFEMHPNSRNLYVLGHTYEEVLRTGLEKGEFTVPAGMTKQERLKQRVALHKEGDYVNVRQVKGRWLQVRDRRTPRGNIVMTAVDVSPLKEKEQQLEAALREAGLAQIQAEEARRKAEAAHKETKKALKQTKKAWREAEVAQAQAEKATQAKSQFLNMMSHEIRTPLQGIINMGQLLMTSIVQHDDHDKLMTILRSSEALLTILNDALDIAKVEAGKLTITNTEFDLKKLIEGVMVMYTLPVQEKDLSFSYSFDPKIPRYLKGDAPKIRQILFNFIDNALKFTPNSGEISVRCEIRPSAHFGQIKLYMAITDTGIGISEEAQHRLFKEFSQADETIASQFGGCGLGLSICKKMINSLEGEIGVESESGQGSTFWVMIDGLEEIERFAPIDWYYGHKNHTKLPSQRLLLVEDNVLNQKSTSEVLQYLDHDVTVVPDGIEALRELKDKDFDLVITDIQMPRLDGFDLIHGIRSLPGPKKDIPIIALTARANEEDVKACLKAGVTKHIAKPIAMWGLQKTMAEVLGYYHDTEQTKKEATRNAYYQEKDQQDDLQLIAIDQSVLKTLSSALSHDEMLNIIDDYQQSALKTFDQDLSGIIKKEDYAKANDIVRDFRCLSGTLGFNRLVKKLKKLETAIQNKDQNRIYDYYHQAEEEIKSAVPILRNFFKPEDQPTAIAPVKEATSNKASANDDTPLLISPQIKETDFHHIKTLYVLSADQTLGDEIQHQLSHYGYTIQPYKKLKKLQADLPQDKPFLLLIDIDSANKKEDVEAFCWSLKDKQDKPCYLMACSDQDNLIIRHKAVQLGAKDFYTKPADYSALVDKLDQLTLAETSEPYRVLIVDDEPNIAKYHSTILKKAGMVTETTTDPFACMDILHKFQPDIILMDINMPGCNGVELSHIIRQHQAFVGTPITFLSGERDYAKHVAALQGGGDEFLSKPIDPPRLVEAVTLRVERLRKLRSYMIRDSLTGLLNHSTIQDHLTTHVLQAERQEIPLSFALIDIDKFKAVNDSYGHPAGDRIIKTLSRYLKQHLRRTDIIGRYGGEEFAIILPNTPGEEAKKVIDKVREGFASLQHAVGDQQTINVSFSAGLAEHPTIKSCDDLIKTADEKLYDAKRKGRNCSVLHAAGSDSNK